MNTQSLSEQGITYSLHIAELIRYLRENGSGFPLCERLLTLGVQVGLHCHSLNDEKTNHSDSLAQAKKDQSHEQGKPDRRKKHKQIEKEYIHEVKYILEMAVHGGYLTKSQTVHIYNEGEALVKRLAKHQEV